jgi:hypothetical protein
LAKNGLSLTWSTEGILFFKLFHHKLNFSTRPKSATGITKLSYSFPGLLLNCFIPWVGLAKDNANNGVGNLGKPPQKLSGKIPRIVRFQVSTSLGMITQFA